MADDDRMDVLVRKIAELTARSGRQLRRVRVESGDDAVELEWYRDGGGRPTRAGPPWAAGAAAEVASDAASDAASGPATDGLVPVPAPVVGTFYRAPQPGAPPFVEEGDAVEAGQPVGIVEAMKIMNHIEAPVAGRVAKVAAVDGEIVEFGQPLLWLEPS